MTLDEIRAQLAGRLEIAREAIRVLETKVSELEDDSPSFAKGHACGLEEAIKLVDKAIAQAREARDKAAEQGSEREAD